MVLQLFHCVSMSTVFGLLPASFIECIFHIACQDSLSVLCMLESMSEFPNL